MKRVWLDLHRWVGLKLSILLSFVLITGTLATVSHEIDWLLDAESGFISRTGHFPGEPRTVRLEVTARF